MSLRKLPQVQALTRPKAFNWDAPIEALERWAPGIQAADDSATISIYDFIGEDAWTGNGWTAKRVAGVLRSIGEKDVILAINSPGGDVFEGIAIYNLFREHKGKVSVKVMGLAASAASVIAMAGDEILMGQGAMMMIHNSWGVTVGNQFDHEASRDVLVAIDNSMGGIYSARSGRDEKTVADMLAKDTWMSAAQAIEQGFADGTLADDEAQLPQPAADQPAMARHKVDVLMAKQGVPRSERRALLRELSTGGMPRAATNPATQDAGLSDAAAALQRLISTLKP